MSIRHDAREPVLQRAKNTDSPPVNGDERPLAAPAEIPAVRLMGTDGAACFAHVWQLFGYSILDRSGAKMGSIARVWTDTASGRLAFVGLTTGRFRRQTHVIPAGTVHIDDHERTMKVPYQAVAILRAPYHNSDISLKNYQEREVYTHYDNS
jgi:hypothetical protein